jgi:cytochrome oxidase Cu insertion factor (SCO1/SenC/PrrC family)
MRRTTSISVICVSLGALVAIAVAALLIWHQLGQPGTSVGAPQKVGFKPAIEIGGPFTLTDHTGAKVTDASFRGKYMLIQFGYTFCPDVCPTGLSTITAALKKLGTDADGIQPVFVTIDPERDTPQKLSSYVGHFYPSLKGLTGTEAQIENIAKAYRVFRRKVSDGASSDYLMDHSTFTYLMNPKGKLALMFRHETNPDIMAKAIAEEIRGKS